MNIKIFHLLSKFVYLGDIRKNRNNFLRNFISFNYNNFDFFNIRKISINLFLIKKFLFNIIINNKKILFVSTKNFLREVIYKYSRVLKQNYVCNKWVAGMLTNFNNYKIMLNKSLLLKKKKHMNYTKKEKNLFLKEEKKIEILYGGLRSMNSKPDLIILTDIKKDKIAVNEAKRVGIKIMAFVDSNDCPKGIDYLIPCNNISIESIKIILKVIFSQIC
ncbi:30S ribosomal protein S2 [Candidatus Carsonella ruddii]|uniref:Small ribosomal subunit protein uS2 n=1 Tax=Carsonella ruddii TaxID=114186 RepID=A0AAE7G410_CARRU|nr:30S ribosomal protein S2 [Candidatus Carsonella ruddii]AGS06510.1 30S ribosomal protein S2 [Candidatus Carsonella ruddii DC]QLK13992.1 30S ribosomal protein S2 [Candidatus Carsonella ruddii]